MLVSRIDVTQRRVATLCLREVRGIHRGPCRPRRQAAATATTAPPLEARRPRPRPRRRPCPKAWKAGWQRLADDVGAPVYCPTWMPPEVDAKINGRYKNGRWVDDDKSYLVSFLWLDQDAGVSREVHVNFRGYPGRRRSRSARARTRSRGRRSASRSRASPTRSPRSAAWATSPPRSTRPTRASTSGTCSTPGSATDPSTRPRSTSSRRTHTGGS